MTLFNKTPPSYKTNDSLETPYQKAKQEWDDRIGNARVQAANWRFVAILSLIASLVLLILLIASLSLGKDRIYVAQVTQGGRVVNIAPLTERYQPTIAQQEYFLSYLVKLIRGLSLDPIVAKQNWLNAYHFLSSRASIKLNTHFQQEKPTEKLGKQTVTVTITEAHPISKHTFQIGWTETTTNIEGNEISKKDYDGVFTTTIKQPKTQKQILQNPLGIYVTDFNVTEKEK